MRYKKVCYEKTDFERLMHIFKKDHVLHVISCLLWLGNNKADLLTIHRLYYQLKYNQLHYEICIGVH